MFYDITKRLIDIACSILGIVIFSPLMLFIALWIKVVSSDGPVFADIPDRVGKDSTTFFMYKFRSMWPGAHEKMLADPKLSKTYYENNYKLDPDPRLIPGAKLFRKTSIDEMPQFFNVLKGQMSIVGPRAYFDHEIVEQAERYPDSKQDIEDLQKVKPGITGTWQVSGRSEIDFPHRAKMDADYAKKRSIVYDLLVIAKTPFAVLSQKGSV